MQAYLDKLREQVIPKKLEVKEQKSNQFFLHQFDECLANQFKPSY